ncbi:MAG: ABC transporter ATP-binding protein [Solirubrobacterales bacterium]|nr:ABC transporter ATP-binding protein [Solirubrobacterales bacterium]
MARVDESAERRDRDGSRPRQRAPTVYELIVPASRPSRRALPRLIGETLRISWRAGARELLVLIACDGIAMVAVLGEVLLARRVLAEVLHTERYGGGLGAVLPSAALLALVTAILGLLGALAFSQQRLLAELTSRYAQDRVLDVTCAVELSAFDEPQFFDRVARAQAGISRMPMLIFSLTGLMRSVSGTVGALAALIAIQPLIAPLVLITVVPAVIAASQRGRLFYGFAFGMTPRDRERRYLAQLLTERDAAKEVRAYNLARFLRTRHDRLYDEHIAELRRTARRSLVFSLLADLAGSAITAGAVLLLLWLTLHHHLSLASATAAAGAIVLIGQRLSFLGVSSGQISESAYYINDFLALLELTPSRAGGQPGAPIPLRPLSRIAAENVTFTYAGANAPALRGVSLHIDEGEVVALVGANGSGKTTLAKLLAGLYLPDTGSVTWNGQDTAKIDRGTVRENAAVIFQDYLRYCLPARDNIALGRHERFRDLDAIERAAERAGIAEMLGRLPDGLQTMLGPEFHGGVDLSVGQWQRVALARVFFRDAPFIVLDEPTAALDARAEHDLFESIRDLFGGRSVVLISHRFSTVRNVDRIYVLRQGSVIEHGTHDELIAAEGLYAELFGLQAIPYR